MDNARAPRRRPARALALLGTCAALVVASAVPAAAATDSFRKDQWGLDVIGTEAAWQVGQGAGVVIAVVDSGVDLKHNDLAGNLVAGRDFVDGDATPQDGYGHGTHVAGIAAAIAGNGRGVAGVAPRARIMPVRVLDNEGRGSANDVEAGIRWAVDNGADVVNLSLGAAAQQVFGPGFSDAVEYAWSKGVVVVVAAGNDFVLSSGFRDEPAIVVSATTRDDREPDYSSGVGGARWGMAAPGGGCELLTCSQRDDVFSTYWQSGKPNVYAYLQGTSMAAPHVAGAAAVLLGLGLSPQQTVDRLLATAKDVGASGRDSTFGSGRLDLAKATAGLGASSGTKPATPKPTPPTPKPRATTPPASSGGSGSSGGGSSGSGSTDSGSSGGGSSSGGSTGGTSGGSNASGASGAATAPAATSGDPAPDVASTPATVPNASVNESEGPSPAAEATDGSASSDDGLASARGESGVATDPEPSGALVGTAFALLLAAIGALWWFLLRGRRGDAS